MNDTVNRTWNELGKKIRALGYKVAVRTDLPEIKSAGGIFYPPQESSFYSGPMHLRLVRATTLSVGESASDLVQGERVCFQRKYFVRTHELKDGSMVGFINIGEVTAVIEQAGLSKFIQPPGGPAQPQHQPM